MVNWKESLSKLKSQLFKKKIIKRALLTATVFTAFSFGTASASDQKKDEIQTIYHVYVNKEYIGIVSNKELVDKMIHNKIDDLEKTYKNNELSLDSKVTYISEQVFHSRGADEKIVEKINQKIEVKGEATALMIGEEPVAFVENEQAAQEVVKKLKLQYITEKELMDIEKRKSSTDPLPPLKDDETRILDISFTKDIAFEDGKATPDKILPVDKAVSFLKKGTLAEEKYIVQEGDVLGSIANDHDLKLSQLLQLNSGFTEDTVLQIGQEVNVTVYQPFLDVKIQKEVYKIESIPYEKEVIESNSMFKGDTKVKQTGEKGKREATYIISEQNGQRVEKQLVSEKVLKEAVKHIVVKGTKVIPSRGTGDFAQPTVGGYISSRQGQRWGRLHKGIDIARPSDRTIKAADNGVVVSAGWDGGYGNKIVIDHQNGFRTVYAHLSSIQVKVGQTVPKGSSIGIMGSTGNSTGVHLHFEVYQNGNLKNPLNYIR